MIQTYTKARTYTTPAWWNLPMWAWWILFGNADDGPYGTPDFMPTAPQWRRFLFWGIRNPLHNLTWYVLGVAGVNHRSIQTRCMDELGWCASWTICHSPPYALTAIFALIFWGGGMLGMNIIAVGAWFVLACWSAIFYQELPLPFIGHTSASWQWYIGWRPGSGAFGVKFRRNSNN